MFAPEPAITSEERVVTSTPAVASALSSAASATSPGQKDVQQDVALLYPDIHQVLPPAAAPAAPTVVKDVRAFSRLLKGKTMFY